MTDGASPRARAPAPSTRQESAPDLARSVPNSDVFRRDTSARVFAVAAAAGYATSLDWPEAGLRGHPARGRIRPARCRIRAYPVTPISDGPDQLRFIIQNRRSAAQSQWHLQ